MFQNWIVANLTPLRGSSGSEVRRVFDAARGAERAGISRNYVSLLELNRKSPTVDVLLTICRALEISAADVIRRVEKSPRSVPFFERHHAASR